MKKNKFKTEWSRMEMLETFVSCLYFDCTVLNQGDEEGMIKTIRTYCEKFMALCDEEFEDDPSLFD